MQQKGRGNGEIRDREAFPDTGKEIAIKTKCLERLKEGDTGRKEVGFIVVKSRRSNTRRETNTVLLANIKLDCKRKRSAFKSNEEKKGVKNTGKLLRLSYQTGYMGRDTWKQHLKLSYMGTLKKHQQDTILSPVPS